MGWWRDFATEHRTAARVLPVAVTGGVMLLCLGACVGVPCFPTGIKYGLWLEECPDTDLRLGARLTAEGVLRGHEGWVRLEPYVRFLEGEGPDAWPVEHGIRRGYKVELSLLGEDGEPVDGFEVVEWDRQGTSRLAKVLLPEVVDGDYTLHAQLRTSFEEVGVDAPLPLYAPAVAHLATDRPLYKPGQTVLMRSVLLERTDLEPLEGRPGRWRILAPDGTEMLVEKDRAGTLGVADTSFPLDTRAEIGTWTASWESGAASDSVSFEVRPFRLPRLTVELEPSASWYGISDRLVVTGVAKYTSGAPVALAPVSATMGLVDGRWPPPIAWEEPQRTRTDRQGRFTIDLGPVPADLMEKSTLAMTASVTEEAGEVARGSTRLVLSKDDLAVEAVTELGNGLVEGFNNRAYLRVTTPDGRPLRHADIEVSNPWEVEDAPKEARTDEDGVAAIQVDPGAPVTVVIPAPPVRQRPVTVAAPYVSAARELTRGTGLDLAERKAVDAAVPAITRCGDLTVGNRQVSVGARVSAGGVVTRVLTGPAPVDQCVAAATRAIRFPVAAERTFALTWQVHDSQRPYLSLTSSAAHGNGSPVERVMAEAALRSRRCLAPGQGLSGARALELHWSVSEDSPAVLVSGITTSPTSGLSPAAKACLRTSFAGLRLDEPAVSDALGAVTADLMVPGRAGVITPQDRTETGYELKIVASTDGAQAGTTRLVLPVGHIPALRMRATPSLASPGDEVVVELFRGEEYYGELPEDLYLYEGTVLVDEAEVDQEGRKVTFQVPADVDGFLHVEHYDARAVVYVRPSDPLEVALSTDKPVYRPGETAVLTVSTTAGGQASPAGVGLMGVDATLGQLAPLLGPDDFGRVTVRATADEPAFGAFDPRALVLGAVRGENAAKAAVLRISQLPMDPAGDELAYGSGAVVHDDVEVLTTSFYRALEHLVRDVRAWEAAAPEGDTMSPELMASLWAASLDALEAADEPAVDAFGRELALDVLPHDLLVQVDPRQVVADGTRLPEDIISWTRYVDEEVRR